MDDTNNLDRFLERTGIDSAVRDTIRNSGLVSVLGYQTELDRGTLGVKLTKAAFARVKLGYEYLVHSKQDREDGDLKLTLTRVLAMDAKDAKSWEQWSLFQWHEKTSRAKGKRKRSSDDEQREDRPIDDFDIGLKLKLPELHDYQKKGILWIKKLHEQEESKRHGGILGDEMGMVSPLCHAERNDSMEEPKRLTTIHSSLLTVIACTCVHIYPRAKRDKRR